jgi:high-affinity iron transporter
MFSSLVIVFRETLEAALLIGIIAAATRSITQRSAWILSGIVAGLAGACAVAALTGTIASMFEGVGQEIFNATVLAIAVALLAWHSVWMSSHGAQLAVNAKRVSQDVSEGKTELAAVAVIVALAVLREGAESVLFVYGVLSTGEVTPTSAVTGAVLGVMSGAVVGALLYWGMLRIPMRWLFRVTTTFILLLAAGMASRMAQFLVQADILPPLKTPLWDLSLVLPTNSAAGTLMHALMGYDASPSGVQVLFYVATLAAIVLAMLLVRPGKQQVLMPR